MEKPGSPIEQIPFNKLADTLDNLQNEKNDGRGVSCAQTVILYLREGDVRKAKAVCWNEADKIVNYPDIRKILQMELFSNGTDEDIPPHFRTSSDSLYDTHR